MDPPEGISLLPRCNVENPTFNLFFQRQMGGFLSVLASGGRGKCSKSAVWMIWIPYLSGWIVEGVGTIVFKGPSVSNLKVGFCSNCVGEFDHGGQVFRWVLHTKKEPPGSSRRMSSGRIQTRQS
jgi:hypothetical protein